MPGHPAADLAALDLLLRQRKIFPGDHQAGTEFAVIAARRHRAFYRPHYAAAAAALDRSGGRTAVEVVVLGGLMPRTPTVLARLQDGLDALHTHFRSEGIL